MSRTVVPFIDIVRLEDKEAKLKAFIRNLVEQSGAATDANTGAMLLIARSIESPAAKAVAALVREGTIRVPVRTVLALAPRQQVDGVSETLAAIVGEHGARLVRDVRLFDAHEQIVIGTAASWIGDCMRRDPMKRDAYECYAGDCSKTAGWARTSFERLWQICEPLPEELLQPAVSAECPPPVAVDDPVMDPAANSQS
jgi:hypothetical protein